MIAKEPEAMKKILHEQPIRGLSRSEEIATAVFWLCSLGASFVIEHAVTASNGFTGY
jgi:NAD(P)-dependent dehydrogenase (short-subunit alcohol dehydrogenase family)